MGDGVLGGKVVSQFEQGRQAAEMVLEIFGGSSPASLSVMNESPNRIIFDDEQLRRFGISPKKLPPGALVINQPYSLYRENRDLIWGVVLVVIFLVAVIAVFAVVVFRMRRTEQALRESEGRYRAIFDNAREGILIKSLEDRTIRYANPALCRFLGYREEELRGLSLLEIHPAAERERMVQILEGTPPQPGEVSPSLLFRRKDGTLRWGEEKWGRIRIDGVDCILGFVTDITDRRKQDEELEIHRHDLERLVGERTAELEKSRTEALEALEKLECSEKQLVRSRDEADAANAAKSEFLANMSHEIRTPLNVVIGMSHLVRKDPLSERQRDYLTKIDGAARALLGVINDILDFSKIEAGKMHVEKVPFPLDETLRLVTGNLALEAERRNTELHLDVDPAIPARVIGDPLRLGQILNNPMSNAVKFTRYGAVCTS